MTVLQAQIEFDRTRSFREARGIEDRIRKVKIRGIRSTRCSSVEVTSHGGGDPETTKM